MIGWKKGTCQEVKRNACKRVSRHSQWPELARAPLRGILQAMTRRGSKNSEAVLIRSHQAATALAFRIGILAPPGLDDVVHNTAGDSNLQREPASLFSGITEVRELSTCECRVTKGLSE